MTFRETLNLAKQHKINEIDLTIAIELEHFANCENVEFNEDQFEMACDLIKDAYIHDDTTLSINMFALALIDLIKEDEEELENLWYSDLYRKACEYL